MQYGWMLTNLGGGNSPDVSRKHQQNMNGARNRIGSPNLFQFESDDNERLAMQANIDIDHKKKIKEIASEFDHTIKFMDMSFEKAFDKKEKDFMLAYRVTLIYPNVDVSNILSRSSRRSKNLRMMGMTRNIWRSNSRKSSNWRKN
jgi:hypothetical protein